MYVEMENEIDLLVDGRHTTISKVKIVDLCLATLWKCENTPLPDGESKKDWELEAYLLLSWLPGITEIQVLNGNRIKLLGLKEPVEILATAHLIRLLKKQPQDS